MRKLRFFLAALVFAVPFAANATIITFNGTAAEGGFTAFPAGNTYSEGGFTATSLSDRNFFLDNNYQSDLNGFDDDVFDGDCVGCTVRFTADDGSLFNAIDVLVAQAAGLGSLRFTGFFGHGGTISTDATGCGLGCIDLLDLSGFVGLAALEIQTTALFMVFDDLQLVKIPEPGTLALLGLGLVGIGMVRRRKTA